MACPYFLPVERMRQATGRMLPAPLGDTWSGVCCAVEDGFQPDPQLVQQLCNFGYARGRCARMPADGPDAVRFAIRDDRDGVISIYWVMEKDHVPFAHGALAYSRETEQLAPDHPDPCIAHQAHAYLNSYLDRKQEFVRA